MYVIMINIYIYKDAIVVHWSVNSQYTTHAVHERD